MTLGDAIRDSWKRKDAQMFGKTCDVLRFRAGFNYDEVRRFVSMVVDEPVELAEFDALLYAADREEANG